MTTKNEITVDGVAYIRKDSAPTGNRCVVVVDRGWVFAGDVTRKDGRIRIDRAIWVFRWEGVGFDGMVKAPKSGKVQLRPLDQPVGVARGGGLGDLVLPVGDGYGDGYGNGYGNGNGNGNGYGYGTIRRSKRRRT